MIFDKIDRSVLRSIKVEHLFNKINDNTDSMTLSTPAKDGEIKIYGNYNNPQVFKQKIDEAIKLREYANSEVMKLKAQKGY